jgi:predicted PurR-regulated permease PerM
MTEQLLPPEKSWYEIWLPRLSIGILVGLVVWYGVAWIFTSISGFLITVVMAFFVAFALLPAVEYLTRRGWRRGPAAGLVMAVGALLTGVFVFAIGNVFFGQVTNLIETLPTIIVDVQAWVERTFDVTLDLESFGLEVTDVASYVTTRGSDLLGIVTGVTGSIIGLVFRMLTVTFFVFYILADWPKLRASVLGWLQPKHQRTADTVTTIVIDKVGGWVYSRGALAAISALFTFAVFVVIKLPYPFALALWVGVVSQFIPTIGTYIAGVVPVFIALVSGDPFDAVWVVVAITVYQQIENYFIAPRITANTMDLHPAVAFGSAIVGASLLGGLGALLALPVAAAVTALSQIYGVHHQLVEHESFESPEQYAARMREVDEARTRRKHDRYRRFGIKRGTKPAEEGGTPE